jgi:ankyrin repeat protein
MNDILRKAARGGHLDIMRWARCMGANDLGLAIGKAARGGHVAALELLWSWGSLDAEVLMDAARGGHRLVVELLLDRGARNVTGLLSGAARGGHEGLCHFAREKGAKPVSLLFYDVAHRGHARILAMLHKWILEDAREKSGNPDEEFDELLLSEALTGALTAGHLEAAELLRSWGGNCDPVDVNLAFSEAAQRGDTTTLRWLRAEFGIPEGSLQSAFCEAVSSGEEDVMRTFREWSVGRGGIKEGKLYLDEAFYRAADNNQVRAMRLLRSWGAGTRADTLETALDLAYAERNNEAAKLLWSWGARLTNLDSDVETCIEEALGGVSSANSSALLAAGIEELLEAFAEPRI